MTSREGSATSIKWERRIFLGVFLYGFFFLLTLRSVEGFIDTGYWVSQIQYLWDREQSMIDVFSAYGQPGTTILELGSLLRFLLGVSYLQAFKLSMIIIIAAATAACAAMASKLFHHPLIWITTVFILLPDRQYFMATPSTAAVMPLIVLIVLSAWWFWEQHDPPQNWRFILLGAVIGASAATRLDASALTGSMVIVVLWHRFGFRKVPPIIAGIMVSFFIMDPYLWFSPIQHVADLLYKFTVHYGGKVMPIDMDYEELMRALTLSSVCFVWSFVLLLRGRLSPIMPVPIMVGLSCISFLTLAIVLSSTTQNIRYLAPFIVVWEVLLPMFVLKSFVPARGMDAQKLPPFSSGLSMPFIGLFVFLHILFNLILRPNFIDNLLLGASHFD